MPSAGQVPGMDERQRAEQVELAARGDADALQRLIVHYHAALRGTVQTAIDSALRRHVDPEDILQQAYIAAFRSAAGRSFTSPAGFYRWLERIALNQVKNRRRDLNRAKRDISRDVHRRSNASSSYGELIDRLASPESTPSRCIARAEATGAVMSCLARLGDDRRQVIRMRFLEGRAVADIADRLGKTQGAVHTLSHRGLKELRRLLVSITRYLTGL